jgi:UDP:flavonoid glycosyltransferase YjiC (YdhE family)
VEKIIKMAENKKINLFISRGRLFDIPGALPPNVKSYEWVEKSLLEKLIPEMDLVVAQGLGLVTRTIRSGIPLLVDPIMPGNFQQAIKVDKYGNGIGLFENKMSLEQALEEILYNNPEKYKTKALQLQKEFSELGGAAKAIELIKEVACSRHK